METISVMQLNLLAPMWVTKDYKELPCYASVMEAGRLTNTLEYLEKYSADVYCLSEVQEDMLDTIQKHLSSYSVHYTSHDEGFWSEWLEGESWKSNGTCVCLRLSKFTATHHTGIRLGDGCVATSVECSFDHKISLVIISVHFDTTHKSREESDELLSRLQPYTTVIISGDMNTEDVKQFSDHGYVEAVTQNTPTTPEVLPRGSVIYEPRKIDHTFAKNSRKIRGLTLNNRTHVCKQLLEVGTDHYATYSEIEFAVQNTK